LTDRVLVIQTAFLGDVVLTTPLLAALAARHGPVDVLTTPAATTLLAPLPAVRQVIPFDKHGRDRGWIGGMRIAGQLRRQEYARAYLPHRSWRSGAIALAARIPERIGFADGARYFYTESRPRPAGGHEVERLLALAGGSGSSSAPPVDLALTGPTGPRLAPGSPSIAWVAEFIAVAPGSIWGTKRWPLLPVRWSPPWRGRWWWSEGRRIAGWGRRSPGRHRTGAQCRRRPSTPGFRGADRAVPPTGDQRLRAAAPGDRNGDADRGDLRAHGAGVRVGPRGARDLVVEHPDLNCRPCSRHGPQRCPLGHHRCMRELTLETVLATIKAIG
jgi:heptosyltransferase-2